MLRCDVPARCIDARADTGAPPRIDRLRATPFAVADVGVVERGGRLGDEDEGSVAGRRPAEADPTGGFLVAVAADMMRMEELMLMSSSSSRSGGEECCCPQKPNSKTQPRIMPDNVIVIIGLLRLGKLGVGGAKTSSEWKEDGKLFYCYCYCSCIGVGVGVGVSNY